MNDRTLISAAIAAALALPVGAHAEADITGIKRILEQMRTDYEERIAELEAQQAYKASRADERPSYGAVTSGTKFNPQISLILNGNYYADSIDGEGAKRFGAADGIHDAHGHDDGHGHEHGGSEQGFNLGDTELVFSATVDPYFDATANLAISSDGDVELEEAWLQTRGLPAGLKVKAGKFFSDIGYANNQHPHQWDFVDQNLAYLNLLGDHGLRDTGAQVTWLPDWNTYTLFGLELLQGEQEKLGALVEEGDPLNLDDEERGPRLATAFVKVSPELGYNHALQLGGWSAWAGQHQEEHEEPVEHALEGDASMWGLDSIYKYDAGRGYGAGDIKLQAEYLWQRKELHVAYHESNASIVGAERRFTEDGFYLQGLYGIAPRWQAGLRYDRVGVFENRKESGGATLDEYDDSSRWTAALSWTPSEFSQLRLQYSRADMSVEQERETFDTVYLQYTMSLGAHGAHTF
ncbi:TonB-dependent receptor [Thiohalomonas denitrificans]|uniref:TonB-dependent receptor n=1 Tax=Thiohalomonas denitrificans TaxID=415747 RepID=UPI0026EBA181|nr:TonB-dependent receptor [Thiohalomonas denitrificans]